jgi:hypothetical protein
MRLLPLALVSLAAACAGTAPDQPAAAKALPSVKAAELHDSVQRLTSRRLEEAPSSGGYRVFKVREGGGQVVVARTREDGSVVTKCIESAEDGFLGAQGGSDK